MSLSSRFDPDEHWRWHAFDSVGALQTAAVERILTSARQAISERGAFHLVLAGGTTPRRVYELLGSSTAEWSRWHIYYGDERCLAPDDPERNSLMAEQAWLDRVSIPRRQIFPIPAEKGAKEAAAAYTLSLSGIDLFDLVLLGLGPDGHTASLFPGHPMEADGAAAIAVFDAPKPPPERVSLSARRLAAARQVIFLVAGPGKQAAVTAWREGRPIPASQIRPKNEVDVLLEAHISIN